MPPRQQEGSVVGAAHDQQTTTIITLISSTTPLKSRAAALWNLFSICSTPGVTRLRAPPTISGITVLKTGHLYPKRLGGSEKLKKSFACYLSTSTGPVAGTLYLSNIHVAFCSDRPLSFTAPSGQETWSYYKVMVPLSKIGTINPVIMREKSI
ncbi:GEM-like protein 5 [Vitis vinifera]|uniref:GEM-like protein 5 n=1 Tax=Vitis vinifera TaxID=29760 RepID=A0A438JCY8_VITVI|nr:GEM-like protein 5 [Vitis vinifera]